MSRIEQAFLPFYKSIVDRPGLWIIAWFLFISLMLGAVGMSTDWFSKIPRNDGPYIFFRDDNPEFQALRKMEATYQTDQTLMFLYAPTSGDVFNNESLAIIEDITDMAWTLPHVIRVDSLANFQHTEVHSDELVTDYLFQDAQGLSAEEIGRIKDITLSEPSLVTQAISATGSATVISAFVIVDDARSETPEIMQATNRELEKLREKYPGLEDEVRLLGDIAFADASYFTTRETIIKITPIGMILVIISLYILLRSIWCIFVVQLMIGLSIGLGYLVFIMSDDILSSSSALGSPMILTLAVADCVHILVTYLQQGSQGLGKRDAMLESLRINFQPVWLTSITTGIGFLFMNFAESPPFNHLGNVVFYGVMFAFALSVTLLPALMMFLPQPAYQFGNKQRKYMKSLAHFTIRFRRPLFWSTSVIVAVLISLVPNNKVNDIFLEYYDQTYPVRQATDYFMEEVGGLQRLQFSVPAKGPGGVMDPAYLENIERLVQWIEQDPRTSSVRSFVEVVKRLNRNMHGGDPDYYTIPDNRALVSQYVLMYEMGLPYGLGLDSQLDIHKAESKLEIVFHRIPSYELVVIREQVNNWIRDNWPDYMQVKATGMDSLFCDVSYDNVKSMFTGTVIALLLVSALLIFTLRSIKYGFLSLFPNLLPTAMAFGIWGVTMGEIGLVASVLGTMTLGIIVDDTVHFLSKYVRAKREMGLGANEATVFAFETVGVSLIATTVILVANFAVMGFSPYLPNFVLGVMTSLIITIALVLDFFFFVPLLLKIDKSEENHF